MRDIYGRSRSRNGRDAMRGVLRFQQDILRNLHPHWALWGGHRYAVGIFQHARNCGSVLHRGLELGHIAHGFRLLVELMQHALAPRAETCGGNLRRHHNDRRASGISFLQTSKRGQRAGASREKQRGWITRCARITIGSKSSIIFHAAGVKV